MLGRDPEFLKLWVGQAISQMGSGITGVALPMMAVLVLGATPRQMGFLSGAGGAAALVFGLFAGAWADRLRRKPILVVADLGRAAVLCAIPLLAFLHKLRMEHFYLVAAVSGLFTVLFDVSYQAYVPFLVTRENLLEGNSKLAVTQSTAEVVAPGLGGVLVQLITAPMAVLLDAASFVFSAAAVLLIRKREVRPERLAERHMLREIVEGLRVAWQHPMLRAILLRKLCGSFFLGFGGSLYFPFVMRDLKLSAALVGIIISVGGASNLLGALTAERLVRRFGFGRTVFASAFGLGLAMLLVPLAHGPAMVCAAFLIAAQLGDLAWPVYQINEMTLRQTITPDAVMGRVNAAMQMAFRGVLPLGAIAGGVMAEGMGVRQTLVVGAVGFLASTLWLVFSPLMGMRELG